MREDHSALRLRLLNSDNPRVRALVTDVDKAVEIYEKDGEPDQSQEQCQLARDLGIGDAWVITEWRGGKNRRNEKELAQRRKEQVESIIHKAQAKAQSQPEPAEPEPLGQSAFQSGVAKPAIIKIRFRLLPKSWSELKIPSGISDLEKLTYVPGLVGDITEDILRASRRPIRMFALGCALVLVGTIIGRRVKGPRDGATHLYILILGRTSSGKGDPVKRARMILEALGLGGLIGPSDFASGGGFERHLSLCPLTVMFIDEIGDQLAKLQTQQGNTFVTDLKANLKRGYNAWESWNTAVKVREDMLHIHWAAPSILGSSTWQNYFKAVDRGDLESGFANRFFLMPHPYDYKRVAEARVVNFDPPSEELLAALKGLPQCPPPTILNKPVGSIGALPVSPDLIDWGWTAKAEEDYFKLSREVDAMESGQYGELALRITENATRCATNVAVGCGREIDDRDMEWARAFTIESYKSHAGGAARYVREYLEFPEMCDRIYEALLSAPDYFISDSVLNIQFGRTQRWHGQIEGVLKQLKKEERITWGRHSTTPKGPLASGWFANKNSRSGDDNEG
jgi:hypothetical protein